MMTVTLPSSFKVFYFQFFYLITDAYQNSGAGPKEMRKWAYEIFSTFLIPNAPMCWNNIDQSLIQSIDKVTVFALLMHQI